MQVIGFQRWEAVRISGCCLFGFDAIFGLTTRPVLVIGMFLHVQRSVQTQILTLKWQVLILVLADQSGGFSAFKTFKYFV